MNRFFRSLGRALEAVIDPVDLRTPRRLWAIRLLAALGLVCSLSYSPFGELTGPINTIFAFGSLVIFMLASELKKLWIRVEQLESEAKLRQVPDDRPVQAIFSN